MIGNVPIPNWREFADDHEEQHAVPTGAALAFAAVASGRLGTLGVATAILVQALERKQRPPSSSGQDLANDVRREPHYFAAGLVIGGLLGLGTRVLAG